MTIAARRSVVAVVAVIALAAGGVQAWRWRKAHRKPPVEFDTAAVDRGQIVARVTATGTLSALVTVQVGTQVSGTIQKLFVDFNSPVKKGQVIARIDPQLFQASIEQAKANLEAAEGNLAKADAQQRDADRQFVRARGLMERKLNAQADYDTALANLEIAKGQTSAANGSLAQAKASLHQAQVNLDYARIVSPTDGVVISRNVDVGQTVAASLQAPTLFVIAKDLREMQVDTSVAEADVGRLSPAMAATFTVDAFPGERFRGRVRQIRNAPQTVQNVVTYDAVIDVENPDLKLRPGMTANVTFVTAQKDDVLRVPNAAMRFRPAPEIFTALGMPVPKSLPDASARAGAAGGNAAGARGGATSSGAAAGGGARAGGGGGGARAGGGSGAGGWLARVGGRADGPSDRRAVWVLRDGKPQVVPLRIGLSDGSVTEVVEGELHDGDVVVVGASTDQPPPAGAAGPAGGPGGLRRLF
jgi:HlyD family secretion protein